MKIIKIISLLGIIFLLSNCQKEIELINPNESRKATVRCLLQGDSIFKLELYKSNKPLDSDISFDIIKDANVEIYDNDGNVETLTFAGGDKIVNGVSQGFYSSSSFVDGTKDYKLKITHSDYKELSSELKFPKNTSVSNIDLSEEIIEDFGYVYSVNTIKFNINDNPSSKDFYNIFLNFTYYNVLYIGTDTISTGPFNSKAFLYIKEGQGNTINIAEGESATLFSDVFFNGESLLKEYSFELNGYSENDTIYFENSEIIIDEAFLVVETLSESYFRYLTTVEKQMMTQGDPFSEAVIIKNNIKNGLGIFGAKTVSRFKLEL